MEFITPITRVICTVTKLIIRPFIGVMPPFITASGAHLVAGANGMELAPRHSRERFGSNRF